MGRGSRTLAVLMTLVALLTSGAEADDERALKLTYYLHDDFVPPDTSAVQVASSNGTFTRAALFGDVFVFDSPLKVGLAPDSRVIGAGGGQLTFLKGLTHIQFVHTLKYDGWDGSWSGSARFNVTGTIDVAILGGTGSFRGASGYAVARIVDPSLLGYIVKYQVHLFLPKWAR